MLLGVRGEKVRPGNCMVGRETGSTYRLSLFNPLRSVAEVIDPAGVVDDRPTRQLGE